MTLSRVFVDKTTEILDVVCLKGGKEEKQNGLFAFKYLSLTPPNGKKHHLKKVLDVGTEDQEC